MVVDPHDSVSQQLQSISDELERLTAAMAFCVTYPFETGNAAETVTVPPSLHASTCPVVVEARAHQFFESVESARTWMYEVFPDEPAPVECVVCINQADDLEELLTAAREASPQTRIRYRDSLARQGARALDALDTWLQDGRLGSFAVLVAERAYVESPGSAVSMLNLALANAPAIVASDARDALDRLGRRPLSWPHLAADARTVSFVGDGPFTVGELRTSQPSRRLDETDKVGAFIDTVVVGRNAIVGQSLMAHAFQQPRPARFLPQEAWVGLLLTGEDWWLDAPDRLNRLVDHHPPLARIRSSWPSNFRWPSASPSGVGPAGPDGPLNAESFLSQRGYSVAAGGPSRSRRWQILKGAVDTYGVLPVANHIAFLARMAKLRSDQRMANAIVEWDHDLAAFESAYHRRSQDSFAWPSSEPD